MRFQLQLDSKNRNPIIPINYQYPLSAAIYKILDQADADYAAFLHEEGYTVDGGLKHFKLFTFSDLKGRCKGNHDRLHINSIMELIVSFHLPEAAQHFVKGLFLSQDIDIADSKSKATFKVNSVEALPDPFVDFEKDVNSTMTFRPLSACVAGIKNDKDDYDFIPPTDARFAFCIKHNWEEKLKALKIPFDENELKVDVNRKNTKPKSRLITVKAFTKQQTRIKGYLNFEMELTGNSEQLQVIYNAGAGLYNALGMGCLGVLEE
ncbi:CRISPR-associated endoribonuclease Cas6 [Algibacter sp. 2305UL17-15]|uniref:CRISPR-associated endoribonuclease Cas6 n=1 Tax=Algibacter sp. 2305UL17-15 TaxID=3231268 RepID=UPI0034575161